MYTELWPDNLNIRDSLRDIGLGGMIILKWLIEN
jgi:hypothetical protein